MPYHFKAENDISIFAYYCIGVWSIKQGYFVINKSSESWLCGSNCIRCSNWLELMVIWMRFSVAANNWNLCQLICKANFTKKNKTKWEKIHSKMKKMQQIVGLSREGQCAYTPTLWLQYTKYAHRSMGTYKRQTANGKWQMNYDPLLKNVVRVVNKITN